MKFELIQALMHVLLTCKNDENPIKRCHNISPIISSMGIFPDAPGQLTPQSVVGSIRNFNSFVILWLSFLPARMKNDSIKK